MVVTVAIGATGATVTVRGDRVTAGCVVATGGARPFTARHVGEDPTVGFLVVPV